MTVAIFNVLPEHLANDLTHAPISALDSSKTTSSGHLKLLHQQFNQYEMKSRV